MIIGIDETGDFSSNSSNKYFFVAVAIDQNLSKYAEKEKQFLEWENSIPPENRDPKSSEMKGRYLTPAQISEFYFEVLIKPPRSFFTILEFDPTENPESLIISHQAFNLAQMQRAKTQREKVGHVNWVRRYEELIRWYRKSNYQRVVKIGCLQNLYIQAFYSAFLRSQILFMLDGKSEANFNFRFKIDKDFVKSSLLRNFWDIYLFKFWEIFNRKESPVLLNNNGDLLKALSKYFNLKDEEISFIEPFYDHTTFGDSKECFEIRMADVLANILHRYHNKGECKIEYESILQIAFLEREITPVYIKVEFEKKPD